MKAVILAGGYAKRMRPLTIDRSKVLLEIGGKPVIDYILEKVAALKPERIYISTNKKFAGDFERWIRDKRGNMELVVENTMSEEEKLGSMGALALLIEEKGIKDDLIVVAGDNIFDFDISGMIGNGTAVGIYDLGKKIAGKYGIAEIGEGGIITDFEEKPERPKTTLISTGIYFIPAGKIYLVSEYIKEGNNPDSPGYFLSWLCRKEKTRGVILKGKWIDIGSVETYEEAKRVFGK